MLTRHDHQNDTRNADETHTEQVASRRSGAKTMFPRIPTDGSTCQYVIRAKEFLQDIRDIRATEDGDIAPTTLVNASTTDEPPFCSKCACCNKMKPHLPWSGSMTHEIPFSPPLPTSPHDSRSRSMDGGFHFVTAYTHLICWT